MIVTQSIAGTTSIYKSPIEECRFKFQGMTRVIIGDWQFLPLFHCHDAMTAMTAVPDSRLPRYLQIRDELMRRICARAWALDEALPAEDKLANEFAVSIGTMRKALEVLASDGIVERVHGRGTFVTRAFERISMMRFVKFSDAEKRELPTTRSLAVEVIAGPSEARSRLGVEPAEKLLYIHRIRCCGDEVILNEHVWLPYARFAGLEDYLQKTSPPLLYPVYDTVYGALVSRAADALSIAGLSEGDAAVFKVPAGTLAVRIQRLMMDHADKPIEWRVSYVTTGRFHYAVEIR